MFPLNLILEPVPTEHFERVKGVGKLRLNKSGLLGHLGTVGGPS